MRFGIFRSLKLTIHDNIWKIYDAKEYRYRRNKTGNILVERYKYSPKMLRIASVIIESLTKLCEEYKQTDADHSTSATTNLK